MEQYVGDRAVSKWFSQDRKKSSHLHRDAPFHEQSAPIENRQSKKKTLIKMRRREIQESSKMVLAFLKFQKSNVNFSKEAK